MPTSPTPRASARGSEAALNRVVDAAVEQWHRHHAASSRLDVPLSVMAVLAASVPPPERRTEFLEALNSVAEDEFAAEVRHRWHHFLINRSDLAIPVWPLIRPWEDSDTACARPINAPELTAALAMARAAVRAGLLELADSYRFDVDVLGHLLTGLRPGKARQALGQYYTPESVAELLAAMTGVEDHRSVYDPTCGTGGMFRAAATVMRQRGLDLTTVSWFGVDVDELAVAACAINAVTWQLGTRVVLGVGNSLTEQVIDQAVKQREETLAIVNTARSLHALRHLMAATPTVGTGHSVDGRWDR